MSAFIVSDKHINTLVTFAGRRNVVAYFGNPLRSWVVAGNEQATAEMLLAENNRSVNDRYKSDEPLTPIKFEFTDDLNAISILKAGDCLAYQSCEPLDWEQTTAFAVIKAIRSRAVQELPGYDEAAWAIG